MLVVFCAHPLCTHLHKLRANYWVILAALPKDYFLDIGMRLAYMVGKLKIPKM